MEKEYLPIEDYAQSANALFHFMNKESYLIDALQRRALVPRYCKENVEYLEIKGSDSFRYSEILVLQKCFCDIPFHKLADRFRVNGTGITFQSLNQDEKEDITNNNTHFDFYGRYAISFSKYWGEQHNLQPVQYINPISNYTRSIISIINEAMSAEEVPGSTVQDILSRIAFCKPLRGIIHRSYNRTDGTNVDVELCKNFHDECEWRYVPSIEALSAYNIQLIIPNPNYFIHANMINQRIEDEYRHLWLSFNYNDIRYIIVPDIMSRINIINLINRLPDSLFDPEGSISLQKSILISKILVLDEIRKDW